MNTFRMEVSAKCVVEYDSVDELRGVLARRDEFPQPFFPIGGGSNLLFTKDFPGTILHSRINFLEELPDGSLRVGAGMVWDDFCAWCAGKGLWGPENLSLIPGEVGAAAVQNIGAYGKEAGELIERVECLDASTLQEVVLSKEDCRYGYRESMFKHEGKGRYVITAVVFSLSHEYSPCLGYGNVLSAVRDSLAKDGTELSDLTPEKVREVIIGIRREKLPDPAKVGSAGSFFRNPVVDKELYERIAQSEGIVPHYGLPGDKVKIPAAWLIDRCGWKNYRGGNAGVWSQPLVIVNATGKARPEEIVELEKKIRASVQERFAIELVPEAEII